MDVNYNLNYWMDIHAVLWHIVKCWKIKGEYMQVEYDPRSESFRVWVSNEKDYNFMKLIESPAFNAEICLKCHQNSIYGKLVSETGIDGKENDNMDKNYIVIRGERADGTIKIGFIFKSKIVGVLKADDGTAIVLLDGCNTQYCTDSYEDIVKQLL